MISSATRPRQQSASGLSGPDVTPGQQFHLEKEYPDHFGAEDIEVFQGGWVYLAFAIDGACSNNGKLNALPSFAVYFGPENPYNIAGTADFRQHHTSQIAELDAGFEALRQILLIKIRRSCDQDIGTVVIKSDSEYVVRGVTEWTSKWKKNDWKNCRGLPVANAEHFMKIPILIEMAEVLKVSVKFWLVRRELNEEADSMAKSALESSLRGEDYLDDDL
ncbi:hypothetical protein ANI_1_776114 [Paecilomyces variotii No. 5]|uniref:ribonuclease H n=1 Tax=Byssochlamys spectabilis (strain No. 5 / NBRC 109023) TaxID=1356009 RepID=V5G146_BYSSN|nr:hypothetical protein ANI_1_776114 [Paecilomyces variotii No. 5]